MTAAALAAAVTVRIRIDTGNAASGQCYDMEGLLTEVERGGVTSV